ncbi:MAG: PAS domain S-box protein [Bacteroidales bacterium]|nr:PAS domain S-box protein [Bacteroidales bacterium]
MIHPAHKEKSVAIVDQAIREGLSFDIEFDIVRSDGMIRSIHSIGDVIKKNEKVIKIFGSFHDITEQKNAERALLESEEKYKALYNNAPLAYQSLNSMVKLSM